MTVTEIHPGRHHPGATLVIFETDPLRSSRFEGLLGNLPELGGIHAVSAARSAMDRIRSLRPDIVVSDSAVGGVSAAEWLQRLQETGLRTRWLVHAGGLGGDGVLDLVSRGIGGVLLRSDPASLVLEGIRSVLRGGTPISPQLTPVLVQALRRSRPSPTEVPHSLLSPREHQMVRGLARGLRYKDLAEELQVSIETVRTHLQRAYRKLDVGSRGEAVARYMSNYGAEGIGLAPQSQR